MPKPNKNNDKDHIIYVPMGGSGYIVGAFAGENPERGEIALLFPALISLAGNGAQVEVKPFMYVESGTIFTLYKTALLGSMRMPALMVAAYDAYLAKERTELAAKE